MPDKSVLECRGLRRRFGEIAAVDGVGFHIDPGETYGLLGPNGAAPMVPGLDRQPLTFVTAQLDHRARRRRHASAGADRLAAAEREPGRPGDDLSRGALVEDIIYTIALTAIQARAT